MPPKCTITFQTETLLQHRINSQVYYFPPLRTAMVFIRLVKQTRENKNTLLFFFLLNPCMWKQTTTNTCHMSTLLTVERQAGICRPKLVGSNTGIVAKMLFCHIGNSKKRSCTIIFNSYSLLTIDQSRRQKKKKKSL